MAKVVQPPPRFTHQEWTYSNNLKYRNAELERAAAERLQAESDRIIAETSKKTLKTQADVDKKFDQRLNDVRFWREEVNEKLAGVTDEIDKLGAFINRVERCIESYSEPLHLIQQCLINREGRFSVDLVHDDVQKELLKEVEVHQGVQALLAKTLEQAKEQLRLNRKAKFNLEKDIRDKNVAVDHDTKCKNLKDSPSLLIRAPGAAAIDTKSVTPEEWQEFSNKNILDAEKQRQNSSHMRSVIDGIMQSVANDLCQQKKQVDLVLRKRIDETRDAKSKLEEHLARVLTEIRNMEINITKLENAINEKEMPLKLAETRLNVRADRPNVEQCRDAPQFSNNKGDGESSAIPRIDNITIRLVEEVNEIHGNVQALSQRLAASRDSLKGLLRRQLDLEEEIQVKANSLYIDEVQCAAIRQSIQHHSY